MDAPNGYPDESDARWQRYPDRSERGPGGRYPAAGYAESGAGYAEPPAGYAEPGYDRYRAPDPRYPEPAEEPYGGYPGPDTTGRGRPPEGYPAPRQEFAAFAESESRTGGRVGYPETEPDGGYRGRYDEPADRLREERPGRPDELPPVGRPEPVRDAGETRALPESGWEAAGRPPGPVPGAAAFPDTPPPGTPARPGPTVYTSRRPGMAVLIGITGIVTEVLMLVVLGAGLLGDHFSAGNVLAGVFGLAGVPLTGLGLYALVTGAAVATAPTPGRAWSRPPLAYLPVGLALLLIAATASAS